MKKQLLIGALSFAAILLLNTSVKAQTAEVTINLADVVSIDPSQGAGNDGDITFDYEDAADYNETKTVSKAGHLIVTSSKNFDVTVTPSAEFFTGGDGDVPLSVLTVKVANVATIGGTPANANGTELTGIAAIDLIDGVTLGSERSIDIDYIIPAAKAQDVLLGKKEAAYTATVTYTVSSL